MVETVRRPDIANSEYLSRGRREMQMIYPPHWPYIGHVLRKKQAEVSILSCNKWMPGFLLLLAWREIRQGMERLGIPALATLRSTYASISLMEVVNWDGKSQDIYQILTAAFNAEDYLDCINNLRARNIDPLSYINSLDKVGSLPFLNGND